MMPKPDRPITRASNKLCQTLLILKFLKRIWLMTDAKRHLIRNNLDVMNGALMTEESAVYIH